MQRIEDGNVSLVLDFSSVDYKRQVTAIHVGVKRTKESTNSDRSLGCVPINVDLAHVQDTKVCLFIRKTLHNQKSIVQYFGLMFIL